MDASFPTTLTELNLEARQLIQFIYPSLTNDNEAISIVVWTLYRCSCTFKEGLAHKKSYIWISCRNNLLRYARKLKKRRSNEKPIQFYSKSLVYQDAAINEILEPLDDKTKKIMIDKVIHNHTFADIAKSYELSVREIYRIYKRAIRKLRINQCS